MKSITTYIQEELDNNIIWKIEIWFNKQPEKYKHFCKFIKNCSEVPAITDEIITNYIEQSQIKLKQFIDFLDDNIYNDEIVKDYKYLFKKVIEQILGNKSSNNIMNAGS